MANAITVFKKYIGLLDEVYLSSSKTAVLDGDTALAREGAGGGEIIVPKLKMDGLADYSRNDGYVRGDVELTMETVKFNYDRGRKFSVDVLDDEETAGLAFGKLASEFVRTRVVPEMDAVRFASYCSAGGVSLSSGTLSSGEEVLSALLSAQSKMDEDEVPEENRILFITPMLLNAVSGVDTTKSREVLSSFSQIVKVPQSRFCTAVSLKDGVTSGEESGGFAKDDGGKDINFMIIHKDAVLQYPKHTVNKVISPEENQESDGYLFFYRAYGLCDVYGNKAAGVYCHYKE